MERKKFHIFFVLFLGNLDFLSNNKYRRIKNMRKEYVMENQDEYQVFLSFYESLQEERINNYLLFLRSENIKNAIKSICLTTKIPLKRFLDFQIRKRRLCQNYL